MSAVRISAVAVPFVDNAIKVVEVRWLSSTATVVRVLSRRTGRACEVEFAAVEGVRILHEVDLAGMWKGQTPAVLRSTWLFEVHEGGWFELESSRPDFRVEREAGLREFIVVGYQECVSVWAERAPLLREAR